MQLEAPKVGKRPCGERALQTVIGLIPQQIGGLIMQIDQVKPIGAPG